MKVKSKTTYRKSLLGGICFASLALSGYAQAAAWTDPASLLPADADIQFKYNDLEIVVDQVGQVLTGIFTISSIGDPAGTPVYWASGLSGSELNGVFTDLTVAQITPTVAGFDIFFTGGTLEMYNVATGSYVPSGPADAIDAQICGGACPDPWLTFDFVSGIVDVDDPTTPGFDESTTTLFSGVTALVNPLTGTGDGNLLVTGGTAASKFNPNMSLQSNLQSCPTNDPNFAPNCNIAGLWPLASFDPVVGSTIPEPELLVLMSAGLLGIGWVGRRRKTS